MQGQRFWIERAFEDGKSESGMADYQVRKWRSWHHHMALVSMAMLFMAEERELHREEIPLLSCNDIETLLRTFLPKTSIKPLTIANNNCKRLVRLINDILDLEKFESGKMAFDTKPIEIMPLVKSTIKSNQAYADEFDVTLALTHENNPVLLDWPIMIA